MGIVNLAQPPDILELNAFVQKFNISDWAFLFFPKGCNLFLGHQRISHHF